MDVYERNLQRLRKAERLVDLAVHSEALEDCDWNQLLNSSLQYAWAAGACLMMAIKNQEEFIAEGKRVRR